jgi:phytoene dehydrogenase-like protein
MLKIFKNNLKNYQNIRPYAFYSTKTSPYADDPSKIKSKYDVVIVGAGHNSLVAANYLAKFSNKSIKICVLESRDVLGGAAVTEEIVPGFKFSRASYLLSLFRPVIFEELNLMRHGVLKFYTRYPSSYTPLIQSDAQYSPKSKSLTLSSDSKFNFEQISKFSKKDAENYHKYEEWLSKICLMLERYLDLPPPSLKVYKSKKSLSEKLNYLRSYVPDLSTASFFMRNYEDIYRLFTEPAANILNEWFESDVLKATLATDSVIGAMISPRDPGSGYVLLHHMIGGIEGKKGKFKIFLRVKL